jgi:alpha-1,3-rhamnosyl/mannosyltransferase
VVRVGLNAAALGVPLTGIGNYTFYLGRALAGNRDVEVYWFDGASWRRKPPTVAATSPAARWRQRIRNAVKPWIPFARPLRQAFQQTRFDAGLRRHAIEVYHEPNYVPFRSEVPVAVTIHDLSWLEYADTHPLERVRWLEKAMPRVVADAAAVIVDSDFTRKALLAAFVCKPERVHAIHLGVAPHFRPRSPAQTAASLDRLGLRHGGYVLTVGTIEPRKNIGHAVAAHAALPAALRSRYPLVVAGARGWLGASLEHQLRARDAAHELRFLGHVDDEVLAALYSGAALFVFPSLYEGFGLPPLEAMASGVPAVVSNRASLPEIAGDAACLLDPDLPDKTTSLLGSLLDDEGARAELAMRGLRRAALFTWDECAARTLAVYRALLHERPA